MDIQLLTSNASSIQGRSELALERTRSIVVAGTNQGGTGGVGGEVVPNSIDKPNTPNEMEEVGVVQQLHEVNGQSRIITGQRSMRDFYRCSAVQEALFTYTNVLA